MKRALGMTLLLMGLLAVMVPPAVAGGSCMYDQELTDERGSEVRMTDDFCFTPTVLRVERGDTVRFVNDSSAPHTVGGVVGSFGNAHEEIAAGEEISFEFPRDGVYPYVCLLHPGMAGAIVVGDGIGVVAASSVVEVEPASASGASDAAESSSRPVGAIASLVGAGFVAGVGLAVGTFVRRRRHGAPA